jgi:hypothetical protein
MGSVPTLGEAATPTIVREEDQGLGPMSSRTKKAQKMTFSRPKKLGT